MEQPCDTDINKKLSHAEDKTNGSVKKVKTPCEALPTGWSKEIVTRKSGQSAGKSDVYYYSPTGKKVRSKPELAHVLFEISGEVTDLKDFDFRAGVFVTPSEKKPSKKRKQPTIPKDVYSKDLIGVSMALTTPPLRQSKKISKEPVTVVSKEEHSKTCNGLLQTKTNNPSPRQIYWERRLQSANSSTNRLEDFHIFSNCNGEFNSLLQSIVKTLQMERDISNKQIHLGTNNEQSSRILIKITKDDILRQEREVVKARKKLAKAITEYEAAKASQ